MSEKMNVLFSFVKHSRLFMVISLALVIVGLAGLLLLPFGVTLFNLDVDFAGGTVIQINTGVPMDSSSLGDIQRLAEEAAGVALSVQKAGADNAEVIIKSTEIDSAKRQAVFDAVKQSYAGAELLSSENVGASVGNDLKRSAVLSALIASLLMLVYITIRFEFFSGLSAVVALVHDILVMMSVYIIFQIPLNMNFIAVCLTILGYSINASIIVFDRIRENRKYMPKAEFATVADQSIRQTLFRNINTTLTTLFPLIMIVILGVSSVRNFAIPLTVGLVSGAYSSVCLAGPLWVRLRTRKAQKAI